YTPCHSSIINRELPSFPTRRSSDLGCDHNAEIFGHLLSRHAVHGQQADCLLLRHTPVFAGRDFEESSAGALVKENENLWMYREAAGSLLTGLQFPSMIHFTPPSSKASRPWNTKSCHDALASLAWWRPWWARGVPKVTKAKSEL